jgi:DNA-binding response OmpR family regulator
VLDTLSLRPPSTLPAPRIFVVEPHTALRTGIVEIVESENYDVHVCGSLDEVVRAAATDRCDVALVAWQSMNGLLSDEHRGDLTQYVRRLNLIIMIPQSWGRMLDAEDLGGASLLEKPFRAEELLSSIAAAMERHADTSAPAGRTG